jgi:hypothetical protein
MPETPAEKKTEPPPVEPTPDPDKERLTAQAAESERRASIAEQRAAYAAGIAAAATRGAAPKPTPKPDILDRYSKEDLTLSPEDKRNMLDTAMRERAAEMTRASEQRLEQRLAQERANTESSIALEMVKAQRPELSDPKNVPLFGAAITKVQLEAQAAGQTLTPAQTAQLAGRAYDQMKPNTSGPKPPFTEQPRGDAFSGLTEEQRLAFQRQPQSEIEKTYGQKSGSVRPPYNINDASEMENLNLEYVRAKNEPLFKRGVVSNMNEVLRTREQQ